MPFSYRSLPDAALVGGAILLQWKLVEWALELPVVKRTPQLRVLLRSVLWTATALLAGTTVYDMLRSAGILPGIVWMDWLRGLGIAWCLASGGVFVVAFLLRRTPPFDPARRKAMTAVSGALLAGPIAVTGAGVLTNRDQFTVDERDVEYQGLPTDLDGLRIVHLSDIHLGPFFEAPELRRVIEMANETRPHLAVVTGDLITNRDDRLTECLQMLSGLRADAGILGCFGNHEERAGCLDRGQREGAALGMDFLRGESRRLRFGNAALNIAGVDYQRMEEPYLVGGEALREPGAFNLLLSHNPDVFPTAAGQDWDLTLAGHTHGGQVTVKFLHQYLNVARVFTPYVYGTYREAGSAIYVTRGVGTVGVPARIGAPPEIGLIRLCAT
jgi:uncharacterized protein